MKNRADKKTKRRRMVSRAVKGLFHRRKHTAAVIVAAGGSTRMGGNVSKQFMEVAGTPVIVRSVAAFESCGSIESIIVVARSDDIPEFKRLFEDAGFKKVRAVVAGADTRQRSVLRGVEALDDKIDFVAIHDGARCLVTPEMIDNVLSVAKRTGAASAGTPVRDTIKRVSVFDTVEETPQRDKLWAAQTPQIFSAGLYRAAAYYAEKDGAEVTDDNSILERLGGKVTMVDCGATNVKITTPEDIAVANALLQFRDDNNETEDKRK